MHFENGDEGKDMMHFALLQVPKTTKDHAIDFRALVQSQQAKTFFDLIFDLFFWCGSQVGGGSQVHHSR